MPLPPLCPVAVVFFFENESAVLAAAAAVAAAIAVRLPPFPPFVEDFPKRRYTGVLVARAGSNALDDSRSQTLEDQSQIVESAANDCLDRQIELLQKVSEHFEGVPWASLPLKIQNVLSTEIASFSYRSHLVKSGVDSLLKPHVPLSTPFKSVQAQNAYQTPLSLNSLGFPPVEKQSDSLDTAERGSIRRNAAKVLPPDTPGSMPNVDRERAVRRSAWSMRPRRVIKYSDDANEDEVDDKDAQVARRLQAEELAQGSTDALPLHFPRRSSRIATTTPTQATVKRRAANTLSRDSPEVVKKPRLSVAESGLESCYAASDDEPAGSVDSGDEDAVNPVSQGYVDDQGLIRVGRQPYKAQEDIRSAPPVLAERFIHEKVQHNLSHRDAKLTGSNPGRLERTFTQLRNELHSSLMESEDGWVKRLCDYTGLPLLWTTGPRSLSLESMYPVVMFEGFPAYHAPPNVCIIMSSLNWAKRKHPAITLPLVSVWLNACQEPDFESRKSKWSWAFNALSNCTLMTREFDLMEDHKSQIERWSSMTPSDQRAILEVLRTGDLTPELEDQLRNYTWPPYFGYGKGFASGSTLYRELQRIATEAYGLSSAEFDYYCTVRSPHSREERVFYPFHILSKPQAENMGWDWRSVYRVARFTLKGMRLDCNRHAEKAGYGEKHVDGTKFIYWMGAYLCNMVKNLKAEKPMASRCEIAFSMLDRWGLPIVPWGSHILRWSLCKKQDHGIAMVFGIADVPDFDPVRDIDLSCASVTLDSGFTNMAMKDFNVNCWDGIRTAAMHIPLHHPFWRVNLSLGNEMWSGEWDRSISPVAPLPEFETHLLSIEAWVEEVPKDQFFCKYCQKQFNTAGQLVEHCRKCRKLPQSDTSRQETPNTSQDTIDKAYWDGILICDTCGHESMCAMSARKHQQTHSEDNPFECDICGAKFKVVGYLKTHKKIHSRTPFKCDACGKRFKTQDEYDQHILEHANDLTNKPNACHVCGRRFTTKGKLNRHMSSHSEDRPFKCDKCGSDFKFKEGLTGHKRRHCADS
ncbi:hypothetical protein FGRMN_5681 [Fusarium graminum]|nr:hypothetical protein FGRMN_5681 [Fusarium graminum]